MLTRATLTLIAASAATLPAQDASLPAQFMLVFRALPRGSAEETADFGHRACTV